MAYSVEDVTNMALKSIGYPSYIGSIYEGTKAARIALAIYGQTRDDCLRMRDWTFAMRFATLTTSGQTPPPPWLFEYLYPADCLRIRYVTPASPGTYPVLDPKPQLFSDFNDGRLSTPSKAILCNVTPAALIYTGQVTDTAVWDSNFVEVVVAALGRRFTLELGKADQLAAAEQLTERAIEAGQLSQTNQAPDTARESMDTGRQQRQS